MVGCDVGSGIRNKMGLQLQLFRFGQQDVVILYVEVNYNTYQYIEDLGQNFVLCLLGHYFLHAQDLF